MITIYASELSAAVGMNKYASVADTAKKVWDRMDPIGYRKAMMRTDVSEPEAVDKVLDDLNLRERVATCVAGSEASGQSVKNLDLDADELAKRNISLIDVQSFVFTERGKRLEESSLDRIEKTLNVPIRQRNNKFYKKYVSYTCSSEPNSDADGGENEDGVKLLSGEDDNEQKEAIQEPEEKRYMIGGKVDGITETGDLVEVKNRQNRIFSFLPLYEKVQIHAYMFLTEVTTCRLVQSYDGQDKVNIYKFDQEFWGTVVEKCTKLVQSIGRIAKESDAQDRLLLLGVFN